MEFFTSDTVATHILKSLGIAPKTVENVVIDFRAGEVPRLTVNFHVSREMGEKIGLILSNPKNYEKER